jgi:hypothetical protein
MLAYVFWHWRQPTVTQAKYENHLAGFHATLADNASPGFQYSIVFKIEGASWLKTDDVAYEEWYVVDDSAALDPLNAAAVSGACEIPHNLVARQAADGVGGLYRWRDGVQNLRDARVATWLAKPAGVSYKDFYAKLQPLLDQQQASLWGRQMTLGPTTEFCIHSTEPLILPDDYHTEHLQLIRCWPQK